MAAKGSFVIGVSVVDSTTTALKKINAQLAALQKPYKDLNKQVQRFGDLTGITKVGKAITGLGSFAINTAEHIAKVGLQVAGIAGIASIGGLVALTSKWSDWGNSVRKTSDWLGTTIAQTIGMSQMSRLLGAAPDAMAQSYEHLSDMQRRARLGLDPVAQKNFRTLNISMTDTEKGMQQIFDLGRKLRENKDFAGMRALFEMFGISADLIKEITTGTGTLADFKKKADESAHSLEPLAEASDKFHTSMSLLGVQIDGVLSKALQPFVTEWTDWLATDDNQQKMIQWVRDFKDAILAVCDYVKVEAPKMWAEFKKGEGVLHDLKVAFDFFTGQGVNPSGPQPSLYHAYDNIVPGAVAIPDDSGVIQPQHAGVLDEIDHFFHGLRMPHWPHFEPSNSAQITKDSQMIYDIEKAGGRNDWQAVAMLSNFRRENASLDPYLSNASGHVGIYQADQTRQQDFFLKYGHRMTDRAIPREQMIREEAEMANYELTHGQASYAKRFLEMNNSGAVGEYTRSLERPENADYEAAKSDTVARDSMSRLHLSIEHINPPPGANVSVATSGPAFPGPPPQVVTTMLPFGGLY